MQIYIILAVLLLSVIVWAFYFGLVCRKYTIYTKKLQSAVRIVHVSDLHSILHGKNQRRLMSKIEAHNPDFVVLTGDIFDSKRKDAGAKTFLKQICKYPCFYVTGNHEYRSGNVEKKLEMARKFGIVVLEDESSVFNIGDEKIVISGLNDPRRKRFFDKDYDFKKSMQKAFSGIDKSCFNVLLAHNNSFVNEYKKYPFDLVLSGHAHGGQFRIPFIMNGFYVRGQGLFPKYAGGKYVHKNLVHIVSRGVSPNPIWCPRIFNPTELVIIDVMPNQGV